ncbi:hypothetical protein L195_g045999 [Trifolium pratense]|uniref:Uncharacterized protein n=1 Tax=Trifolium pratense TaxID=57577 RepID=A0A2K3MGG2_TRIPR|nr:hypothetical protein L195_g045999 [Trifolium pratense]
MSKTMCNGGVECIFNCIMCVETIGAAMLNLSWMKEEMNIFNSVETDTGGQLARFHLPRQARVAHAPTNRVKKHWTQREKLCLDKAGHVAAADWSGGFL